MSESLLKQLAIGAVSGAAATVPMSWAMELMHQVLPEHERQPLPPRQITEKVAERLGVNDQLSEEQRLWLSLAAHFGYGAAVGSIYAAAAPKMPGPPLVKGSVYGVAVWAGSYLGLLPGLGILKPATRHPARRAGLMILAHLVWGTGVAIFSDSMKAGGKRSEHPDFLAGRKHLHWPEAAHA
jgi:uncharacterized membrane protein YagU involved in acid resistance